ncbi:phosphatase [Echinicola strongylocentroti]|uniref:Phosphatase n=1 Tax=Echinicola strongylocentroti TaxID=1795355 RepID=A0A2Z4II61_9BACT|nr:phosphatase [Echinicola strongylocentroti]AWW30644.1 phosphatase [Echinicola strongylocentroti]
MKKLLTIQAVVGTLFLAGCGDDKEGGVPTTPSSDVELANHSSSPVFLKLKSGFEDVEVYNLLSSEDQLENTPDFVYGSMADGAGLMKNDDGTFTLLNNIEADYSVARISFDETFKPVGGEYILNAEATASTAQCSGSLITMEEHGFGPLYLSGGEWGGNSKGVFMTDPAKDPADADVATLLPALGQWSVENAVAIGKEAYPGQTVVFIGDDTSDNETPSGQVAMYIGDHGDLSGGKLYGLKVTSPDITYEMDMVEGEEYEVEFLEYEERTYDELEEESRAKGFMGFSRVEDIDWRRGSAANNREIYVAVTGRKNDPLLNKGTFYGRVYKIVLDEEDPTKATISCVLDGDKLDGKAKAFHSPDNILVTENYVYIQEDPNGYFDQEDKMHFAQLYQYDINTGDLRTVLECDQDAAASQNYGTTDRTWELTGMIDVSDILGEEETFVLITQNHGWENDAFTDPNANPTTDSNEGSMLYVLKGLKR